MNPRGLDWLPRWRLGLEWRRRQWAGPGVGLAVAAAVGFSWAAHRAYRYTESVPFCGLACHPSMAPQYSAYLESRHSQVGCVDCHVAPGVPARIRSKLEGAQRVWARVTDRYSRPIHASAPGSRPTRHQCKQCHEVPAPPRDKVLRRPRYRHNRESSRHPLTLVLKKQSGHGSGETAGVDWHMTTTNTIQFRAVADGRREIPWVQVRSPDGRETTYVSRVWPATVAGISGLPLRRMECVDCHNRLAHASLTPDDAVDQALDSGKLCSDLPSVKHVTVAAITADYPNREAAHHGIRHTMASTYSRHYPQAFARYPREIERAIEYALDFYDSSVFPELGLDWRTHPNQLGHRFWAGCFRCHDGQHVGADGRVLPSECGTTCHTPPTLEIDSPPACTDVTAPMDWHPWQSPIRDLALEGHERLLCADCHEAGRPPKSACSDCHGQVL